MRIRILHGSGCGSTPRAVENVNIVLRDLQNEVEVEVLQVSDSDDLVALRYFGSPTIQVDGVDIEPASAARNDFGGAMYFFYSACPEDSETNPNSYGAKTWRRYSGSYSRVRSRDRYRSCVWIIPAGVVGIPATPAPYARP